MLVAGAVLLPVPVLEAGVVVLLVLASPPVRMVVFTPAADRASGWWFVEQRRLGCARRSETGCSFQSEHRRARGSLRCGEKGQR